MIDGTTPLRLTEFIHDAIVSHKSSDHFPKQPKTSPKHFPLQTTSAINSHIERVRKRYRELTLTRGYRYIKTSSLSHGLAKGTGFSSKTCLDFTLQLAGRMHFDKNVATWEPISVQHFHRGRPDPRQSVTESVVSFCEAALDESVALSEKKRLLAEASTEWDVQTKRSQEGSAFLRRTEALLGVLVELSPLVDRGSEVKEYTEEELRSWTWADSIAGLVSLTDTELPKLFTNDVFNRVYPGNLEVVRNEGEFVDAAGYVMEDDCIWISNRVREN
jgi:hypothetical protein